MSDNPSVTGVSTSISGRFIISARENNFVADATEKRGGLEQALLASELFLSSLVTCGLSIIANTAYDRGLPINSLRFGASYAVDPDDRTRFEVVNLDINVAGVSRADAESLVKEFTNRCPIYNTVARTTPIRSTVSTDGQF